MTQPSKLSQPFKIEIDYSQPAGVQVIEVVIIRAKTLSIVEETVWDFPVAPPGKSWLLQRLSNRDQALRWQRERVSCRVVLQ